MTMTCAHDLKGKFRTNSICVSESREEVFKAEGRFLSHRLPSIRLSGNRLDTRIGESTKVRHEYECSNRRFNL